MTKDEKETRLRSLLKSASYIVIHEVSLLMVALFFTKDLAVSAGIVLTATLLEASFYYFHERVWLKIKIGKR